MDQSAARVSSDVVAGTIIVNAIKVMHYLIQEPLILL
jgi:hypothetical protein